MITTKPLLDRIPLKVPGKTILLEEAAAAPRFGEKLVALLLWFLPGGMLERVAERRETRKLQTILRRSFFRAAARASRKA